MSANGRLEPGELVTVQVDPTVGEMQLEKKAARAFLAWQAAAADAGYTMRIAAPAGAYRSFWLQGDMHKRPERYNLNPASTISLAQPGYSTHGDGRAVDIGSFRGDFKAWGLATAARFGFYRSFGEADPNHFKHDGKTVPAFAGGGVEIIVALSDDDVTKGVERLRHAEWGIGENGATLRFAMWCRKVTDWLVNLTNLVSGYGRRTEDMHANNLPRLEQKVDALGETLRVIRIDIDDAAAELIASKVKVPAGATKEDVEAVVSTAFANVFRIP